MSNSTLHKIAQYIPENNRIERIWKLAQVDFKKRYYNDRLGLLWALIKPIFEVIVYYMVFTVAFKVERENFALFIFCGIIFWMLFAETTTQGIWLLSKKLYLIENIQFNRIDLYYSYTISVIIGFTFNIGAYFLIASIMGVFPDWDTLYIPLLVLNFMTIAIGVTMILSSIQPFLKDIWHAWDMVLIVGFWTSGIFFDLDVILDPFPWALYVDPFLGMIHNAHAVSLNNYEWSWFYFFINMGHAIVIFILGLWVMNKYGRLAVEKL